MSAHHAFVHLITDAIFSGEDNRLKRDIKALIDENNSIIKKTASGFNYKGKHYSEFPMALAIRREFPMLHRSLVSRMGELSAFQEQVDRDREQVRQTLNILLHHGITNRQDQRDALPECVVDLDKIHGFKGIQRTREPAFNLEPGSTKWKLFQRTLPKIEMYCATRLMY